MLLTLVALRKESVDRNLNGRFRAIHNAVALRKESVDRNTYDGLIASANFWSLSARRAWIEIIDYIIDYATDAVALRKESVDRNSDKDADWVRVYVSLSARRAWIEILTTVLH